MAKKMIKENAQVDESGDPVKTDSSTAAASTLHPGAKGINDAKSRVEMIAQMIGAAHAAKDEDLVKHFNSMMAYHDKVGHGMGVGDNSGHNKGTLATHPSAASHISSNVKEAIKQDVETMLDGQEGLTEEFKTQAATLFEAAVEARVAGIQVELTEAYNNALEVDLNEISEELVGTVDQYLDYAATEWMKENEVAIESALRNEMTTEFIAGLRQLFVDHSINIPEEQVEVVDTMAAKIEELESRLNDALTENAALSQVVSEHEKAEAIEKVCEGLTLVESEKLRELVENIEADDVESFTKKATVIKESNFVKGTAKKTIVESMEQVDPDNAPTEPKKYSSPQMKSYAQAISRSLRQV
jgi:hypothetical protein